MITQTLFSLKDEEYRKFQCKLIPNVDEDTVIGIRTPQLRQFAKEIKGTEIAENFLKQLPHRYYEENNLHAFLIEYITDFNNCISALNTFLPYINNWATCDSMSPKVLKKYPDKLLNAVYIWIKSNHTYTVRFGILTLMRYFLDDNFSPDYPKMVASIKSDEYYINMMRAWYFATALTKQYDDVLPFLENNILDKWTHNKSIQKAIESFRITAPQKAYLKTLKRK